MYLNAHRKSRPGQRVFFSFGGLGIGFVILLNLRGEQYVPIRAIKKSDTRDEKETETIFMHRISAYSKVGNKTRVLVKLILRYG